MDDYSLSPAVTPGHASSPVGAPTSWGFRDARYGGLKCRYRASRRRLVREPNPFTGVAMAYRTPLEADNGLLRLWCPGSQFAEIPNGRSLYYLEKGKRHPARCDLITTFRDGIRIADMVARTLTPEVEDQWGTLRHVATSFGIVPKLRLQSEIRSNMTLLSNLGTMNSHAMRYAAPSWRLERHVLDALPSQGSIRRDDLVRELQRVLPRTHSEDVDTILFRLYRSAQVAINIAEVPYGPGSDVAYA